MLPRSDPAWWQLPLVLLLSAGYQFLFIRHGLSPLDEGWPLYAAMRLQAGGELYRDVFWVFPPGALLPAWLGYALDPPGVIATRFVYACFDTALCGGLYLLGRRLMTPAYALLGAGLLAVAAPHSHLVQVVFGYRYLLFSVLALLCFSQHLRDGRRRWLVLAGSLTGVALLFRLTPAFAVSVGIGVGILVSDRDRRGRLEDALRFAGGFALPLIPVLLYFGAGVGLETLWREVVVRPVAMTQAQALPVPPLFFPEGLDRWQLERAFAALEFRLYPLLYAGYALWLAFRWLAARRAGRAFEQPLLLTTVVWGGLFLLRSFGRADVFHLESAIPPVCLLIAHLAQPRAIKGSSSRPRTAVRVALILVGWMLLKGVDLYARPQVRGAQPLQALSGRVRTNPGLRALVDPTVETIDRLTQPGEILLDLSGSPLMHVLTGRMGVGYADLLMPGTFADSAEESAYLERIVAASPAVVLVPRQTFDGRPERAAAAVAPRIFEWVEEHYEVRAELPGYFVLARRRPASAGANVRRGVPAEVGQIPLGQ